MAKAPKKSPVKPPRAPKKRPDRRGCPKGGGVRKGGAGARTSGSKPKGRIGNPPHVRTAQNAIRIEAMVAAGAEQWFIAEELGLSEDTLQRHYRPELDHGKKRVDWKVGGSIAQKALAGDPDFQKFYAARRAGWKTTTAVEASGPDGGPIEYRNLSEEELDARIKELLSGRGADPAKA
jgi:hypothetical protein